MKQWRVRAKCWQRQLREAAANEAPHAQMTTLAGCYVKAIPAVEAKPIIMKYEWLGTMGRSAASYGLYTEAGELIGVALFGWPGGVESRDICGKENRHLAVCLERGACVHWAHQHAASFLISRAVKLASDQHGWRIFYAYSDEEAGEIGTVYQACNWIYIGQGVGRSPGRSREYYKSPDGKVVSSRWARHNLTTKKELMLSGWTTIHKPPKHKYIWIEADRREKKTILAALRYPPQPYPKREATKEGQ